MRQVFLCFVCFVCFVSLVLTPVRSGASQDMMSFTPDRTPVFLLRFFDRGEIFAEDMDDPSENQASTWTLSPEQQNAIVRACDFWSEIIQPAKGNVPALIHVGTMEEGNADAESPVFTDAANNH